MTWTGSTENREIILQTYRNSFANPARQFILNYGKTGSSKTHAANYFTTSNPIPETVNDRQVISILLSVPEVSSNVCHDLLSALWEKLTPLKDTIAANIASIGEEKTKRIIHERIGSYEFAQAIVTLCVCEPDTNHDLLSRYFFTGLEKEEMQFLKI